MDKFLIFIDDTDDAAMYPLSSLLGITVAGEGAVIVKFKSSIGKSDGGDIVTLTGAEHDLVALTITADTEVATTKQLIDKIAAFANNTFSKANFLEVANSVTNEFLVPAISAVAITQDS